jgi:hypothetical protein
MPIVLFLFVFNNTVIFRSIGEACYLEIISMHQGQYKSSLFFLQLFKSNDEVIIKCHMCFVANSSIFFLSNALHMLHCQCNKCSIHWNQKELIDLGKICWWIIFRFSKSRNGIITFCIKSFWWCEKYVKTEKEIDRKTN